ncbi:uncharacterized protein LOC130386675 isoform X1 [Gadus chalcogrammus]|uniref:uncharacterized protein LOC130386675 isoform X1 n=2 Tax=Gadus chalcogrammus TaxID=1042646 RepID=UPI0024C4DC39|nr:uncharacterized protein LOC130386675 isoform X1 [Gadus chalcogrammus]
MSQVFSIPSGKELPRTPPMGQVKKELVFTSDESPLTGTTMTTPPREYLCGAELDESPSRRLRINSTVCPATVSSRDPISMIRGMDGYQLTQADKDFIERKNEERLLKPLEGEQAELDEALRREAMALGLALARQEKALEELKKFPPCGKMVTLARLFLGQELPDSEVDLMNSRTLLTLVKEPAVRSAISKQKSALVILEDSIRKKEEKAKEDQEKRIQEKKHEIKGLMIQMAGLQSELTQEKEKCATIDAMAAAPPPVQIKMKAAAPRSVKIKIEAVAPLPVKMEAAVKQEAVTSRPLRKSSTTRAAAANLALKTSASVTKIPKNAAGGGTWRKTPGSAAVAPLPATTAVVSELSGSLRRSKRIASKK